MRSSRQALVFLPLAVAVLCASGSTLAEPPLSAQDVRPLLIGAKLPELTLKAEDGSPLDLNESVAAKPTVLIFYRGGW